MRQNYNAVRVVPLQATVNSCSF